MFFLAALKRAMTGAVSDDSENQRAEEGEGEAKEEDEEQDQMNADDDMGNSPSLVPVESGFGETAHEDDSQVRFHLRNT